MPLSIEFLADKSTVVDKLLVHKIGLNLFLPINPPDRGHGGNEKADIFLEIVVSGINYDHANDKIGLRIKHLFSPEYVEINKDSDCSDMFIVPYSDPFTAEFHKHINTETLYGYFGKRDTKLIQTDDNLSFDWNEKLKVFPSIFDNIDVQDGSTLIKGDLHLWTHVNGTFEKNRKSINAQSSDNKALAFWVKWSELMSQDYFDKSQDLFEHHCNLLYSGVTKIVNFTSPLLVDVIEFEVVITLPIGCRDDSDYNPLLDHPGLGNLLERNPISDWVEKKEKVHNQKQLFKQWQDFDLENRRFVLYSANGNKLINRTILSIVHDNRGDMQRQSDLTIASVVVAAGIGVLFPEIQILYNCLSALKWSFFNHQSACLATLFYLLIPVTGFLFIDYRVHGRRWIPENFRDTRGIKKLTWVPKAIFRYSMRSPMMLFCSLYADLPSVKKTLPFLFVSCKPPGILKLIKWTPRSIHRLVVIIAILFLLFEYQFYSKDGLRNFSCNKDLPKQVLDQTNTGNAQLASKKPADNPSAPSQGSGLSPKGTK